MYKYYYKYNNEEKEYIIYADKECKIIIGILYASIQQLSLLNNIGDMILIYKGEIKNESK